MSMRSRKRILAAVLALTMSASLMTSPALAAGVIGEKPFSDFETQVDETLATLSLRHRASLMQGGIEKEIGQDTAGADGQNRRRWKTMV